MWSKKLRYRKYVLAEADVEYQDGVFHYDEAIIDTDDSINIERGYKCRDCGHLVAHCGYWVDNEKDLIAYLIMDPSIRDEEQYSYDAHQEEVAIQEAKREKEKYENDGSMRVAS